MPVKNDEENAVFEKMTKMEIEQELHLRKAQMSYDKNKISRKSSMQKAEECIALDFQKKIWLPNLSTNDVYYHNQLSYYLFNITVFLQVVHCFMVILRQKARKGQHMRLTEK